MIIDLAISGLGVIDQADVAVGPGFTVLTGETGAGKTMVLTALAMLRGQKVSPSLVRGQVARVEGRWSVGPDDAEVADLVGQAGGVLEDGELLLARTLPADGRARAFAGGVGVPAAVLGDIAGRLVAVHGQSDQIRLRNTARQRRVLDAFAGSRFAALRAHYGELYAELAAVETQLTDRVDNAEARLAEAERLRHGLDLIEQIAPEQGEDESLRAEEERLANVDDLATACAQAHAALSDDDGAGDDVLARLAGAVRLLDRVSDHDAAVGALADRLRECAGLLADAGADLASYGTSLDADPARLAWVQDRRADLSRLTRTYGPTLDDVLAWGAQAAQAAQELDGGDDAIAALRVERERLRAELAQAAEAMSRERSRAAEALAGRVTAELAALAMPDAKVQVDVTRTTDPDGLQVGDEFVAFGPEGIDNVEFLLSPHRGAAPAPLGQGASGGELSRVMLAVEVALAGVEPVATMVFDEVDSGVGGKAAVEIGRRLARLARHTQVLVVTHLPQVAAFADTHLVVTKDAHGAITASSVTRVAGAQRERELARMLAGQEDSDHALAHAAELLALGEAEVRA